jgi:hypothetical protein
VMNLRWGRKGYLASVIFRTFEHVHGITDLPKPIRHPAAGSRDVNVTRANRTNEEWSIVIRLTPNDALQISRVVQMSWSKPMAGPKNDKHKEYARYAAHCLKMVPVAPDQKYRVIQREMAAEWLKLADAIRHPLKPSK